MSASVKKEPGRHVASVHTMLPSSRKDPLYLQLADMLEAMIRNRSLRAGDRMPSVRVISARQRVSIPTALQAYVTLESRGLVEARPKSGFYVRSRLADRIPEPEQSPASPRIASLKNLDPVESLLADHADPRLVPLGAAIPSSSLLPGAKLARIMSSISRQLGPESISYDLAPGYEPLRRQLARRSLDWGCALNADDFLITVGATEAMSLALRATCKPGDTVIIESPTYFGLANTLCELRLNALPIPVHPSQGINLNILEKALRKNRVAACVVVPNFHNPLGCVMPDEQKQRLVQICEERSIALIEDDTYGDLSHDGSRPRCLKAFGKNVILCGSFSKKMAPGYRVGYLAAGKWQDRARSLKQTSTLTGALLPAMTIAAFLNAGSYDRYLRSVRQAYRQQVARMREAIVEHFPEGIALSRPRGGYLLWCELPRGVNSIRLMNKAREAGISIAPGPMFSPVGAFANCIRINCGYPWSPRIENALKTLGGLVRCEIGTPSDGSGKSKISPSQRRISLTQAA